MPYDLYSVNVPQSGRLSLMARPRGGEWLADEIALLRASGVDVLVSLLLPEEIEEFELTAEGAHSDRAGVSFVHYPIPDRGTPESYHHAGSLIQRLRSHLGESKHVAIHCRQGIGRASLIAAGVLVAQGFSVNESFDMLAAVRGRPVPDTDEQRAWVEGFAEFWRQ